MTETSEQMLAIDNPAWDYIKAVPQAKFSMRGFFEPENMDIVQKGGQTHFIGYRSRVTARWAWAIPSPMSLTWIVEQLQGRSVVELGAGNGYWAWCLSQMGVDVNAYDIAPVGHEHSWFHEMPEEDRRYDPWHEDWKPEQFHPVEQGSVEVLTRPENADRVLFLCWPNYDSDFAYSALRTFPGEEFIYIGEHYGCNGDWQFGCLIGEEWFYGNEPADRPAQEWTSVETGPMVQWSGLHDQLSLYRRMEKP
jgi:hypothetical protein